MKKNFMFIILFFPISCLAQSQQDMMTQMQEMANCMQSIDQNKIKALEVESKQFSDELKGLCQQGKRDKAQEKAIDFSKKTLNSTVLKDMRKCTEKMPASMKGMMPKMEPTEIVRDYTKHHVCDEM